MLWDQRLSSDQTSEVKRSVLWLCLCIASFSAFSRKSLESIDVRDP
jgi:hypothetical protein